MEKAAPNIFDFDSYRSYLSAFFQYKKNLNSHFSYGAWAKQLGLKNNTSLLKIINGSRDAGPEITQRLVGYFKFSDKQRLYFEDLIQLAKSKDNGTLKVAIMERLKRQHPLREFRFLEEAELSVVSEWWHLALRQFSKLKFFKAESDWLSKRFRFKVTPKQITKALKNLEELKLIEKRGDKLLPTGGTLNTSDDVSSEGLKRFHEGILENAHRAIRQIEVDEREISGVTLAFSSADLENAKKMIRKFEDEFDATFGGHTEADSVYQMEVAFFPLTKKMKETDV